MKPALLLVDLQGDYLKTADLEPEAETLVARAAALLEGCRRSGVPVVFVWTTVRREDDRRLPHWKQAGRWMCVAGTTGHAPPASLRPIDGDVIVHKAGFDPFADGELEAALGRLRCEQVILAGLHLHACIRSAALGCLERGHRVVIADDATASNDPIHASATRRWLAERCVTFQPVVTVLSQLAGTPPSSLLHRSPRCTDEVLFEVPVEGASRVQAATAMARQAWIQWRRTPGPTRRELLEAIACGLEAAAADLARLMALEIGKPLSHGHEEVWRAIANVRDVIRRHATWSAEQPDGAGLVCHRPLGVVALISPWNNPVAIPIGKIAPALAYGNTVVWKPAPAAMHIAQVLLERLQNVPLIPGAVQLVTGDHTTAQHLAADTQVDAVTFTGSLRSGWALQEICARRMTPLQAELSGNNAAIVWGDTDLARAAAQIAWGAFAFAGQRCTANRRAIVHAPVLDAFLREVEAATARLPWGDPLEASTELGPVIDLAKRDEVTALVRRAQAAGVAERVLLPKAAQAREPWVNRGAYAQPAIVGCDQPDHALVQEETMGPLLVVQAAGDFAEALALCNGVRHGLVASLFTTSPTLQERFREEARAGLLKLNTSTAGADITLPFGGWKASGLGPPEHGVGDALFYTRMQAVYAAGGR